MPSFSLLCKVRFFPSLAALALCALTAGCGDVAGELPAAADTQTTGSALTVPNSALRFDAGNAEIVEFARGQGWVRPGVRFTVTTADLVYTNDDWKTTHVANIQYLLSGYQGFIVRGLPIGTEIEYAVHAEVAASYDDFRSYFARGTTWANNGGENYKAKTTDVSGR